MVFAVATLALVLRNSCSASLMPQCVSNQNCIPEFNRRSHYGLALGSDGLSRA